MLEKTLHELFEDIAAPNPDHERSAKEYQRQAATFIEKLREKLASQSKIDESILNIVQLNDQEYVYLMIHICESIRASLPGPNKGDRMEEYVGIWSIIVARLINEKRCATSGILRPLKRVAVAR